jgi:hypothetical protein
MHHELVIEPTMSTTLHQAFKSLSLDVIGAQLQPQRICFLNFTAELPVTGLAVGK